MGGRKVLSVCGGWQPGIPHLVKTSHVNTPSRPKSFNIEGKKKQKKHKYKHRVKEPGNDNDNEIFISML